MKTMVVWRTVPGKYKPAIDQFLKTGGPLPAGVQRLGRWHVPGSILGWHLIDGDPAVIAEHVAEWADFLELEVYPVIEDDAAGAAAKKVYGKEPAVSGQRAAGIAEFFGRQAASGQTVMRVMRRNTLLGRHAAASV
jgi:hypothetical protein